MITQVIFEAFQAVGPTLRAQTTDLRDNMYISALTRLHSGNKNSALEFAMDEMR